MSVTGRIVSDRARFLNCRFAPVQCSGMVGEWTLGHTSKTQAQGETEAMGERIPVVSVACQR